MLTITNYITESETLNKIKNHFKKHKKKYIAGALATAAAGGALAYGKIPQMKYKKEIDDIRADAKNKLIEIKKNKDYDSGTGPNKRVAKSMGALKQSEIKALPISEKLKKHRENRDIFSKDFWLSKTEKGRKKLEKEINSGEKEYKYDPNYISANIKDDLAVRERSANEAIKFDRKTWSNNMSTLYSQKENYKRAIENTGDLQKKEDFKKKINNINNEMKETRDREINNASPEEKQYVIKKYLDLN